MHAITYRSFGTARDVLTLEEIDTATPAAGEVRVRLAWSGVNPSDVKARAGSRPGVTKPPFPTIVPHSDGAGVIEALGPGVSEARLGERVWIWNGQWRRAFGTAATHIALPSDQAVPLPDTVSLQTGAILGIPALTAAHAVFSAGPVRGKSVLVQGAAGTVGYLALQLAQWGGARVIATARGAGLDRVGARGPDAVVDFSQPDLADAILAANDGAPVDHIVEPEFGLNIATDTAVIAENGSICAYGSAGNMSPVLPFSQLMFKAVRLEAALVYLLPPKQRAAAIDTVHAALTANALDCPVGQTFRLSDTAAAHEAVEAGNRSGAILIDTATG